MDRNIATPRASTRGAKTSGNSSSEAWFQQMADQLRLLVLASDTRLKSEHVENIQMQESLDLITDEIDRLAAEVAERRAENIRQLRVKAKFLTQFCEDDGPDMLQQLAASISRDIEILAGREQQAA